MRNILSRGARKTRRYRKSTLGPAVVGGTGEDEKDSPQVDVLRLVPGAVWERRVIFAGVICSVFGCFSGARVGRVSWAWMRKRLAGTLRLTFVRQLGDLFGKVRGWVILGWDEASQPVRTRISHEVCCCRYRRCCYYCVAGEGSIVSVA